MKNLPIGVDDYLAALDSYYIDKTLFIKELLDYSINKSLLVTRPRRFGKSLMLSMVEYYFTNKGDYKYAFTDKNIYKEDKKYLSYMNSYPVIRLNMKNINSDSAFSLISQTIRLISEIYRKYPELMDSSSLFDIEKNNYKNIANQIYKDPFDYSNAIRDLSMYLYKHYHKKVIILIDEYDTPIQNAYDNNFYNECISFFKSLYSSALKGNENVFFAIITGVLEVGKESLFSGLNNLNVQTVIDDGLNGYFGFTKDEVKDLLNAYKVNIDIDKLAKWYGGYGNKFNIFNPWSILNYINYEQFDTYWANTGTNNLINDLIEKTKLQENDFANYLNSQDKTFSFDRAISYKDLNGNVDALFSFLTQSGYLNVKKVEDRTYQALIPNEEIKIVFEKEIITRNINFPIKIGDELKNAITNMDNDKIMHIIGEYVMDSFSYYDFTKEKDYQILVVGILKILFDEYYVESEPNSRFGRCDILISPKTNYDFGIGIELKKYKGCLSNKKMEEYALKAIAQIKDKKYYQTLKINGCKKIILYGFAFDDNKMVVRNQIEE